MHIRSKRQILVAWHLLRAIECNGEHDTCDVCGGYAGGHVPECEIAAAMSAIDRLIPPLDKRDEWLKST